MNPIYYNDEGQRSVGVTSQQLELLRATRPYWFKFLKVCNAKGLQGEQKTYAAIYVMMRAVEALEKMTAEDIKEAGIIIEDIKWEQLTG